MQHGRVATCTAVLAAIVVTAGLVRIETVQATPAVAPLVQPDRAAEALPAFFDAAPPDATASDVEEPSEARRAFEERYPEQAAAVRKPDEGDGDRWALLIGINEHLGSVADNVGSRQDAERLHATLVREGWDEDRIVLVTDTDATGAMIREGLAWLGRTTGPESHVVFHYSGHSKKWYGSDGAIEDQALWPTDDDFVGRDELGDALAEVEHVALWGNVATCEAAGFTAPGVEGPGRVWTFSSTADEKSYEDPEQDHSVWGAYFLDQGLWRADGQLPAVQEAFVQAASDAEVYTSLQEPYGPQTPVLVDDLGVPFELAVPDLPRIPHRLTPTIG